jgi:polar amino acid transport system substrate-binding protein
MKSYRLLLGISAGCISLMACGPSGSSTAGSSPTPSVSAQVRADLVPTGSLRVALPLAPPIIASKDPSTGELKGIGVDLGKDLAARLGVPFVAVVYPKMTAAMADSSHWDIVFGPTSPSPAADFSSPFLLIPHTYLVATSSGYHTAQDVDQTGVKIASVAGSPHTPKLQAALMHATVVLVPDDATGITKLEAGQVQAYASGGFDLFDLTTQISGYRVVDGAFFTAQFGIGLPKGHAAGMTYISEFVSAAETSGLIQQAITRTGKQDLQVAPAE